MTSTNSLLFEGPNLEEVLAEAKLVYGPDVEIEAANRIRKGGIMGFFATEWYEVWARSNAPIPAAVRQIEREDEADTFHHMVENALAERVGESRPPSDYEQALDRFFGPDGEELPHRSPAPAMALAGAPAAGPAPSPGPAPRAGASAPTTARAVPAPEPTRSAAPRRRITPVVELVSNAPTPATVALEDAPRGTSVFDEPTPAPQKTDLLWAMLERLDAVPAPPPLPAGPGLVVFVGAADLALETARRMGAANDRWTGNIAVLSRRTSIAGVPDWLLVNSLDEAIERAERWRQREGSIAIVIDIELDEVVDRKWAIDALTALDAAQVRLTTEAWRLPDDIGRIAGKLGGVDTLDLVAVTDAIEPLAMLDLDIPVGTIEGRPASPELLAAVWLENRRAG